LWFERFFTAQHGKIVRPQRASWPLGGQVPASIVNTISSTALSGSYIFNHYHSGCPRPSNPAGISLRRLMEIILKMLFQPCSLHDGVIDGMTAIRQEGDMS